MSFLARLSRPQPSYDDLGVAGMTNAWYDDNDEMEVMPGTPNAGARFMVQRWPLYRVASGIFSQVELESLATCWDDEILEESTTGEYGHEVRVRQSWPQPARYRLLYDRIYRTMTALNGVFWKLDLAGFVEPIRALQYDEGYRSGWHADYGSQDRSKLTFVAMCSRPGIDFQGGTLKILNADDIKMASGDMIVFPSHLAHKVTPVVSGHRRVLAGWLAGPPLR